MTNEVLNCKSVNPDFPEVCCQRDQHYGGLHTYGFGPNMVVWRDPDRTVGRISSIDATKNLLDIRNRAKKERRTKF